MRVSDIIERKKQGLANTQEEIHHLIQGYVTEEVPDYQVSAWLMAVVLRGMTFEEMTYLTKEILESGEQIDLSSIDGICVDKHSTGGVGDKTTLVVGPIAAACGLKIAKMSGRGLGHTGGTLDKLESIPGFQIERTSEEFMQQVSKIGISVIGQTANIAPADKKLYSLRDVTATVDVIPLIASSIMSKKLASGADAIVLDVKVGHGAFMKSEEEAIKLAELMVSIGRLAGKQMTAILTGMDEPLGHKIGNGLEVYEAIETLNGQGPKDLVDVTVEIGAHLLIDSGIETDFEKAKIALNEALHDGRAYQKFLELVQAQGGDLDYLMTPENLLSKKTIEVTSDQAGYVMDIHALKIGKAAMRLGAGRETKEDDVLYEVGLDLHKKIGDYVNQGEVLATLYIKDKGVEEATLLIKDAFVLGDEKRVLPLIKKTIK